MVLNVHQIASGVISAVNPSVPVTVKISNGYTTNPDGTRTAQYLPEVYCYAQIQPLQFRDIAQVMGLNLQGIRRAVYLTGEIDGLVRAENKGGDLVIFPNGLIWLVAIILEQWPDWVKAAVTLQNNQ